ncbi:ATP-binding cassette domain-containing protein [Streptomyces sp. NPDC050485]|uniref:ATP-binding cassette domain-containing protein n=1 Tax=Streptomyces sp. NPDC050485 TaxID=3365617 RepID=UPI00378C0A53
MTAALPGPSGASPGRFLREWLRRDPPLLLRLLLWTAVESVPALLAGRLVATAVDRGFLDGAPLVGLAWLAGLAFSSAVGAYGARNALARSGEFVEPMRDALVAYTVERSLERAVTETRTRHDLSGVARLTRQVEIVREAAGSLIAVVCRFAFAFVGVCLGTLTLAPMAAVLIFAPVLLTVVGYVLALRGLARIQLRSIVAAETLAQEAWELSAGLRDITACGMEESEFERVDRAARENVRADEMLARMNAVRTIVLGLGGWLPLLLILLWARWGGAGASAGTTLGILTYVMQSLRPAVQSLVQGLGTTGIRLLVTLGRLLEPRGAGQQPTADHAERPVTTAPELGVTAKEISFSYSATGNEVLSAVDMHVSPGEHVAVVGPSGVGKSTLAAIMAGTLAPVSGTMKWGEVNVGDIPPEARARLRTYLPQEAYVFSGSLRENLVYLCEREVPDAELDRAAQEMGLGDLVRDLGGYESGLKPESLSAGERQLIALTRAYLSPARLTILDEATCHLDQPAEARAEQAMRRRPGTLVVIAHRMSSAEAADRVLVLDGTNTRQDTHQNLQARPGLYRDLAGLWQPPGP